MKRWIGTIGLIACISCSGAIQKIVDSLPTVIQYVTDAQLILDRIDQSVRPILALKNDEQLNQKYAQAIEHTRSTLQVALRSAKGGQSLSQDELDAAFSDFRTAYVQLRDLLQGTGLMSPAGTFSASSAQIPEPLALQAP